MNFLLGLFMGMAIISVIGFLAMMGIVFSNGEDVNIDANAEVVVDDNPPSGTAPVGNLPPIASDEYFTGDANAAVTIIEYTDFECPFCFRHHQTSNQLLAKYGNDVKYVLRHFPLSFHPSAQKAAEAYECAGDQSKPFEMADKLFDLNNAGTMSVDTFKTAATQLGLNASEFNTCLDSGKYEAKVTSQASAGAAAGITGTPATFINGQIIEGAVPIESFEQILDSIL
ncbi:MAG: thioredoxin domain-containing protein [Calditrichaeota bacterium]|nr:thioredoxin domain-containing protein [Calditrichota bacterium]